MAPIERPYTRGTRRGSKALIDIGDELRHARLRLGVTQGEVALAARVDRADLSRIENAKLQNLTIRQAYRIGAVVGLDLSLKAYPAGASIRDAGQAVRLQAIVACISPPLTHRTEVALPRTGDFPEQRAWDLMLYGHDERTGIEFERRLYDLQAQLRRFQLKRRDDPVDHFLLVVANTKSNRRVVAEFADLLADLPRLRTATVLAGLRAGEHPPTGLILLDGATPSASQEPAGGVPPAHGV